MFIFLLLCGDIEFNLGFFIVNILNILYFNICSIRYKLGYLNYFIYDFDILCFIEIYLDFSVSNDNIILDGFS